MRKTLIVQGGGFRTGFTAGILDAFLAMDYFPFDRIVCVSGGAIASSYFQNNQRLVSVVGDDFPIETLDDLKFRGVDLQGLQVKSGQKTFFWSGKYHNDMNSRDTLVTELNVLADFDPIIPKSYQGSQFLMLGNLSPTVQRQVIERLETRPVLIAMDTMNFWMDIAWDELIKTLLLVDILIINDEEARQLTKEYSLVKAAKKIKSMGPNIIVIKKGEHGALLFYDEKIFFAPALPLEDVFDPTGAGDTFAGGFMGYLSTVEEVNFENLKRAIIVGSAMASFCVGKFGTERLMTLTDREIESRIQQFVNLVQFDIIAAVNS
jgi:sugar/nucleoside kinase (ribokinase family)